MAQSSSPIFSVRIVQLDFIMASPIPGLDVCLSPFESEPIHQVPVVRIWGSTPAGQQACLHLHRVGHRCDCIGACR